MPTKATQLENQRIPKLRFSGFSGMWEYKELADIFSNKTKRNSSSKINYVLTNSAIEGIVSQQDYFDKDIANQENLTNYYIVDINDFIYNPRISKHAPVGPLKRNNLKQGIMSPLYTVLKPKIGDFSFLESYFETKFWHKYMYKIANYGARHDRMAILQSDFIKMPIPFPSIAEQQKIAEFLGATDKLISNLKEQKENHESYKKGMMQKIFSQQICFKDETGKEFPKWREKKLSEIGKSYNGLQGKSGEDFGEGEPYITYKQIFDSSELDVQKFSLVKVASIEKQNKAHFGDVFFTVSSETPLEVGFASVLLNKEVSPYLNSFSFGFRVNSLKEFDPYFLKFFFRTPIYRKKVVKLAQGSTRYNISKVEFMKMSFKFPSFSEQQKIADFLTSVDKVIESKQQQITEAEQWKQGLIQGLFV